MSAAAAMRRAQVHGGSRLKFALLRLSVGSGVSLPGSRRRRDTERCALRTDRR
jgi:hypothetical protein